ncbi:hypothetical protein GYA93_10785 [Gordonia desulfuricans]|uniref:Uncharacterized protein n=1 Tax=Gordonia desulfuricans TaxID=89051 RepID=A0A7K3LPA5_9ACTN|nr:hypothetical protein [Gordonia desulfuricans]NDK90063.1 hypothetical protein [Gordonia desulfuricans]
MKTSYAVRIAGVGLAAAIGTTIVAAPALAAPSSVPGAVQVAAAKVNWTDVSKGASAVGDKRNAQAAQWVLAKHAAAPVAADKSNVKQSVLAASAYGDVAEPIVTDAANPSVGTAAGSTGSSDSGSGSSGSSTGSSTGSLDLGSSNGSAEVSYNDLKAILETYFASFDWSVVTIPLIATVLQAQGVPSVIATPLAKLIWQVIETTFPAYAN